MTEFGNSTALIACKQADRQYKGVNLAEKHSAEIQADYAGNVWKWVQARIKAGNFSGIHVNDYIPFTLKAGTVAIAFFFSFKTKEGVMLGTAAIVL